MMRDDYLVSRRRGFTLVEIMVAAAIFLVMAAALLTMFLSGRTSYLSSDAYIPFRDNIDRANRSNVGYVAQTGSSLRDDTVTDAADGYGMVMVHTGLRSFLHG